MQQQQLLLTAVEAGCPAAGSEAETGTSQYVFNIQETSYTRLCLTKKILTVNGQFPGPTLYARKGDTVTVRVNNLASTNITLHWHGLRQPRNPWSDGPEYIAQCPIQPGKSFTYTLLFSDEEGTIWWHAHSNYDRATVHGALIVLPSNGSSYPYPTPYKEIPIIISEWWNADPDQVIAKALATGAAPSVSDAYTINGQPGDFYNCSRPGTFTIPVVYGKTYLFRVINAAMSTEHFFAIAGHRLTVVGTDGSYTKPYSTDYLMITPGQTMDLLVTANSAAGGRFYMAARPYMSVVGAADYDTSTTTAILQYAGSRPSGNTPAFPSLPKLNDTAAAAAFINGLRSLASKEHPVDVPQTVDQSLFITVSVNLLTCEPGKTCGGPNGDKLAASLNNLSFVLPPVDVLDAYYKNISGVFGTGFPAQPPQFFNFTGENLPGFLLFPQRATEVRVVEYNSNVEIVFQGTSILSSENHPMHLHGYSFYVVGRGIGNFDKEKDPLNYNLVDPPLENTVGVPKAGWAAIRFRAQNPGVWFMHCHIEEHTSWGMDGVLIVTNGPGPNQQLLPPPPNMPPC